MPDLIGGLTDVAGDAYGAAAGTADYLAGSTDEAVARTFDDKEGGGVWEGTTETLGGGYSTVAGAADYLAGSTDEAVARQFDDERGGGILEGFGSSFDAVGSTAVGGVEWGLGGLFGSAGDVGGAAAGGYTGAISDVGESVFGEWFQWWMPYAALLVILFIFRDEIGEALGLYATGGASAAAGRGGS